MSFRIILRPHSWVLVHDLCRVLFAGSTSPTHHCTRNVVTNTLSHVPRRAFNACRISFHTLTLHVTHLYIHNAFFESPVSWLPLYRFLGGNERSLALTYLEPLLPVDSHSCRFNMRQ